MGLSPAVVTSVGIDQETPSSHWGIPFHEVPAAETTTFHNIYDEGGRTQILKGVGSPISPADVPAHWTDAPVVLLGPMVGEVSYDLVHHFHKSTVVACMQGWLRRWDAVGRVTALHWDGDEVLPFIDAAVVSSEDVEDAYLIDRWAASSRVLIVTNGSEGSRLHLDGRWHEIAPFAAEEVDQTGAGDVYAAAYLLKYHRSRDPLDAARFASCTAAMSVEAEGYGGIPTLAEVEARLALEQA